MGGLENAGFWNEFWSFVLVIFAAAAGYALAVAAATLFRRSNDLDLTRGYNALAPLLDR